MDSLRKRREITLEQAEAESEEDLDGRCVASKQNQVKVEAQLKKLRAKEKHALDRLQAGRGLEEKFEERGEAEARLNELLNVTEKVEKKKRTLL